MAGILSKINSLLNNPKKRKAQITKVNTSELERFKTFEILNKGVLYKVDIKFQSNIEEYVRKEISAIIQSGFESNVPYQNVFASAMCLHEKVSIIANGDEEKNHLLINVIKS